MIASFWYLIAFYYGWLVLSSMILILSISSVLKSFFHIWTQLFTSDLNFSLLISSFFLWNLTHFSQLFDETMKISFTLTSIHLHNVHYPHTTLLFQHINELLITGFSLSEQKKSKETNLLHLFHPLYLILYSSYSM